MEGRGDRTGFQPIIMRLARDGGIDRFDCADRLRKHLHARGALDEHREDGLLDRRGCDQLAVVSQQDRAFVAQRLVDDPPFLVTDRRPPDSVADLITNPPYGEGRRGELAVRFIEHALELKVPRVAMLLRNDFDSALTRQHLFRFNPYFSTKIVLLNRIKWFDGPSSPSDNHSWFIWDHTHAGDPPAGGHSCNGDDTTFYGC